MKLDVPARDLGEVNAAALIDAVLEASAQDWQEETLRQERYEQHHDTESLILCFCDGWPNLRMMKGPAWDSLYPCAAPVINEILNRGYKRGGKVVRMMAAKLKPGGHIALHSDTHPSFDIGHRIHVPLQTNDQVEFIVDGLRVRMRCGHAYEIDNKRRHEVSNRGAADRIHLIFDYVPPEALEP
ncbi:MAG TPA: aspartyl/asparaginyl beta-hydroxylase domain-containing protein [Woeseiaceae bacterium]|nr:aspartyl/asparaginyl beta-hydroxylase domain-containing protein [Woeseiaceae bacterium]